MTKKIIFPVTNAVAREKLRNLLLNSVGEYMDVDISVKTVAVLEVTYPKDRQDIEMLLNAIYNNVTKDKACAKGE